MAKNKVEGKLTLDIKDYEKKLKRASKTTQDENKKISNSNNDTSKKSESSSRVIMSANNNAGKSYSVLRASSSADMDRIRSATSATANSTTSASQTIAGANNSAGQSFNGLAQQAQGASQTVAGANSTMGNTNSSSSSTQQNNNNATGRSYTSLAENVGRAQDAVKEYGEATVKVGETIKGVGDTMTKTMTAPVVAVGTASATMAIDYEHSFAKVTTLLDESKVDFKDYSENLKDTAKDMGTPLGEFSEATYQAISAGQDYGEAVGFVAKNVKLAKGGFTDTTTAVNTTTTILNTYGEKAGDIVAISDKLIATQNKGKTTVGELGSSLADVIPTANSLNLDFNELLGTFAHLTAKGIQTSKAGTMTRAMLDELGKSGTKASNLLKEKTGKTFTELMDSGKSLTDVLGILDKGAKDTGLSIGDMFGSSEASGAAKTILGDLDNFNASVSAVKDSAGSTEKAYATMMGTIKEKIKKAMIGIQESMVTLGEKLSPVMDVIIEFMEKIPEMLDSIDFESAILPFVEVLMSLIEGVINVIKWFSELDKGTQDTIIKFFMLGAMIAPIISFIGQLVMTIGAFMLVASGPLGGVLGVIGTAFGAVGTFITATLVPAIGGVISAFIAFIAPALPVIAVIGAIIAVGVLLYKNWDVIKEKASELWEVICEKFEAIKNWITEKFEDIKEVVGQVIDNINTYFNAWFDFMSDLFGAIFDVICQVFDNIWTFISGIGQSILEALTLPYKMAMEAIKAIMDGIKEHIGLCFELIKALFSGDFEACGKIVEKIFGNIKDTIGNVFEGAIKTVKNAIEKIKGFFNFEWKLPDLKMPHFKFSGSFSLNPLSVPKLGVDWYSKGAIFTKPTVMGGIGVGDANNGIGSNAEAILPIDKLPELLGLDKDGGGFKMEIGTFINNTEQDVPQLMKEIYYAKRARGAK